MIKVYTPSIFRDNLLFESIFALLLSRKWCKKYGETLYFSSKIRRHKNSDLLQIVTREIINDSMNLWKYVFFSFSPICKWPGEYFIMKILWKKKDNVMAHLHFKQPSLLVLRKKNSEKTIFVHSFIHSYSVCYSFILMLIHSFIHSFLHSFFHSFNNSFIHSFI